jgi:hypothetical protein
MVRMPNRRQAFRAAYPSHHHLYSTPAAQCALSRCYGHMYAVMADHAEGTRWAGVCSICPQAMCDAVPDSGLC